MKKKKMLSWALAAAMVLGMGTTGVLANEDDSGSSQTGACDFYSVYPGDPIPEEGEAILLEDYSMVTQSENGFETINVNQVYSVRIQNSPGDCSGAARVTVSGSYRYDSTSGDYSNVNLHASPTWVPTYWTVEITQQYYTIEYARLRYTISYRCLVDDYLGCMVSGGYWYSGATFTIR